MLLKELVVNALFATTSVFAVLLVVDSPTPLTALTPMYNLVVAEFVTFAKFTKIEGLLLTTTVP